MIFCLVGVFFLACGKLLSCFKCSLKTSLLNDLGLQCFRSKQSNIWPITECSCI